MKLLNLACGAQRPASPIWTNLDLLHPVLLPGTPERIQLDSELNYVEHDLSSEGELPFKENLFDGILMAHALEHFDCQQGVRIMRKCRRVLKIGGLLVVSVPDASYFRKVYHQDNAENCERLFGEPLREGSSFFETALWYKEHKMLFTEDGLWAYFERAAFKDIMLVWNHKVHAISTNPVHEEIRKLLNRLHFSIIMRGSK